MNDPATQHAGLAVRASDAEREQTVALLQRNFADGRLTQAELEERAYGAYKAQTRAELCDLIADLPAAQQRGYSPAWSWTSACCTSCCASTHPPPWSTGSCAGTTGPRVQQPTAPKRTVTCRSRSVVHDPAVTPVGIARSSLRDGHKLKMARERLMGEDISGAAEGDGCGSTSPISLTPAAPGRA
jgi:Domain of unknown function (DUF1707)